MPASLRRSLADPFSLGDELAQWIPPVHLPKPDELRIAVREIERTLQPATAGHIAWCVGKMSHAMASRKGDATTWAMRMEGWIDACGHFPDDLWSAGTLELLQTKTYFPAPAEMVELIGPKYRDRQRMLERAKTMLGGPPKAAEPAEKPLETPAERIRHSIAVFTRLEMKARADAAQRKLDALEGPESAICANSQTAVSEPTERPPFSPDLSSPTTRRCAELAEAARTGKPPPEHRDVPEVA